METSFLYDAFLSYSSADREKVLAIAKWLKDAGLRVWLDQWAILPGDSIPSKVENGLERSRVLIFCMSAHSMGSDWPSLERYTFLFRDPLNKERRFIPLRLDEAPILPALAHFSYIDWTEEEKELPFQQLVEACRPVKPEKEESIVPGKGEPVVLSGRLFGQAYVLRASTYEITALALSPGEDLLVVGSSRGGISIWDLRKRKLIQELPGLNSAVVSVVISTRGILYAGTSDGSIIAWNIQFNLPAGEYRGSGDHAQDLTDITLADDETRLLTSNRSYPILTAGLQNFQEIRAFAGIDSRILSVVAVPGDERVYAGGENGGLYVFDFSTGVCELWMSLPDNPVFSLDLSWDGRILVSALGDRSICIWDTVTTDLITVLEGHTGTISKVVLAHQDTWVVSGGHDGTVRVWDLETGDSVTLHRGVRTPVTSVIATADGECIIAGSGEGAIYIWENRPAGKRPVPPSQSRYTNAKVLLVGESGAGKSGLSLRLAKNTWEPTDSTVGGWATRLQLPVSSGTNIKREIWLWDFGGQADQRLIHQLYMDETALVVLVFDGQKEDVLETLLQWDRDLRRASTRPFVKILAAARTDAGGLRVSRQQIETFAREYGYSLFLETSAKEGTGCDELRRAIISNIQWNRIPWRSAPELFNLLRDEIVRLKDRGRVLLRYNELRETLRLTLPSPFSSFTDEELQAVIGLLAGPGVVWELGFGSLILLQPEYINAYGQAVIRALREDLLERGCLAEEKVLSSSLHQGANLPPPDKDDETFILQGMHRKLIERQLCLREQTEEGPLLIFPSYYRRERPDLGSHPPTLVSYQFNGFLDEIYATLIVRLHFLKSFRGDSLWRYAADFRTLTNKPLGLKMTRQPNGRAELEVYFDPSIPLEEKIIFSKYVHEHLLRYDKEALRLRHYVCPYCYTPVADRELAMKKLREGKESILCINCEDPRRIPLFDEMEELFASEELTQQVRRLRKEADIILDNESKERLLVGEVISTVALAGQIGREKLVSDHGIDMEIEFKSDDGKATGKMVYLQLKSGDSYLQKRKTDGAWIFRIPESRHADYWRDQPFPVMLVIRNSAGEIRWMDIRQCLRSLAAQGGEPVKQIIFESQRFDVMAVRKWREEGLKGQGWFINF